MRLEFMRLRVMGCPAMRSEVTRLNVMRSEASIPRSGRAKVRRPGQMRLEFMRLRVMGCPATRPTVTIRRSGWGRMLGSLGSMVGLRRWRCGLVRRCC
ncbi:hypothetical protein GCM10009556_096590 [Acrocarpospora pleiomorpha]